MTEQTKAVARRVDRTPLSRRDPVQLAEHFAKSGFFKDAADMSKAVVKIVAGEEMGLGPMAAMSNIYIIEGKPSLSANILATLVKKSAAYDYIVRKHTDTECAIEFLQNGESIGTSEFTLEDAKRAGIGNKQNFQRYPKAMLFARAMSQGVRWYCPDVTAGSPAYVPEELGAVVDEGGEPVETERVAVDQRTGETQTLDEFVENNSGEEEIPEAEVVEPLDSDRVAEIVAAFGSLSLSFQRIGVLLSSCGINGLTELSAEAVTERLESLTPAQADTLETALGNLADKDAEGETDA